MKCVGPILLFSSFIVPKTMQKEHMYLFEITVDFHTRDFSSHPGIRLPAGWFQAHIMPWTGAWSPGVWTRQSYGSQWLWPSRFCWYYPFIKNAGNYKMASFLDKDREWSFSLCRTPLSPVDTIFHFLNVVTALNKDQLARIDHIRNVVAQMHWSPVPGKLNSGRRLWSLCSARYHDSILS